MKSTSILKVASLIKAGLLLDESYRNFSKY